MRNHNINKEKLFRLSNNIRFCLWIILLVYSGLVYLYYFPKIIMACMVLLIDVFMLASNIYFKKTLGAMGVTVTGGAAFFWTIVQFILMTFIGVALLVWSLRG